MKLLFVKKCAVTCETFNKNRLIEVLNIRIQIFSLFLKIAFQLCLKKDTTIADCFAAIKEEINIPKDLHLMLNLGVFIEKSQAW